MNKLGLTPDCDGKLLKILVFISVKSAENNIERPKYTEPIAVVAITFNVWEFMLNMFDWNIPKFCSNDPKMYCKKPPTK